MEPQKKKVYIVGVGMTKFYKPSRKDIGDYPDFSPQAVKRAMRDANITFDEIEQIFIGYAYGDSCAGQRALYEVGMSGVPITNVNNNCATGSTAVFNCKQLIEGGIANCCLAFGFEKMARGSLQMAYNDRAIPVDKMTAKNTEMRGKTKMPFAPQLFGNAGREHMEKYGSRPQHFAKIAYKNHKHSVNNPYSQFQDEYSLQQILDSTMIHEPLTKLQCCPTSNGAAAAIICSEEFMREHGLEDQAVEILHLTMTTDTPSTYTDNSNIKLVGGDMTKEAAKQLFETTGYQPADVDVCEVHDCFSANELITYEGLGLCGEGKAGEFIDNGDNTYGGQVVVNPSGGLISKGHPLGATGIAQMTELCWQLRKMAGKRQVDNA